MTSLNYFLIQLFKVRKKYRIMYNNFGDSNGKN